MKTLQNNWNKTIFRAFEAGGSLGGTSLTKFIITGKTAPLLEPQLSLEDSASFHPVFTSLDFMTFFFLQSKVFSPASNPQPGGAAPQ
jgi:hypothetical protein